MKLYLTKALRQSLAGELKKLAWAGGAVFSVLGVYTGADGLYLLAVAGWFLVLEVAAHIVLATTRDDS